VIPAGFEAHGRKFEAESPALFRADVKGKNPALTPDSKTGFSVRCMEPVIQLVAHRLAVHF